MESCFQCLFSLLTRVCHDRYLILPSKGNTKGHPYLSVLKWKVNEPKKRTEINFRPKACTIEISDFVFCFVFIHHIDYAKTGRPF